MSLLLLLRGAGTAPSAPAAPPPHSQMLLGPYDLISDPNVRLAKDGYDRGAAEPDVTELLSRFLDGSRVVGDRATNRTLRLPIWVSGTGTDRAARLNALLRLVNSESWPLVITPAGGLPVVLDCFRGRAPLVTDLDAELQGVQGVEITAPALPYLRSAAAVTMPLAGRGQSIDGLTSLPTTVPAGAQIVTTVGGASALQIPVTAFTGAITIGKSFPTPVSLGDIRGATVNVLLAKMQLLAAELILVGASGHEYVFQGDLTTAGSGYSVLGQPGQIIFSGSGVPEPVTGWRLFFVPQSSALTGKLNLWDLQSFGGAIPAGPVTGFGGTWLLPDVPGSARTPINLTLTPQTGRTVKTWLVHRPPADQPAAATLIPLLPTAAGGGYVSTGTAPAGARWSGSWTVYVSLISSTGVPGARSLSVVFGQQPGGTAQISAQTWAATIPGLIRVGVIDLPLVGQPPDATSTMTVTVNNGVATDVLDAVLLVSTEGETILCQAPTGQRQVWVDEPDPRLQTPGIYGSSASPASRLSATSLAGSCLPCTVPLSVDPGRNTLLVYSPDGPLSATATAYPRWLHEADR